ncbi:hypothetical protein [Jeotgalicoccus sp. WY2]|nr:hypothetical protein [Jeotgalicoccus sp. WY2]
MKNNILLKGLDLSYSKEAQGFKKRMLGNAGSIQLKNITFIYMKAKYSDS